MLYAVHTASVSGLFRKQATLSPQADLEVQSTTIGVMSLT